MSKCWACHPTSTAATVVVLTYNFAQIPPLVIRIKRGTSSGGYLDTYFRDRIPVLI